jgi:hypothetical protein
LDVFEAVLSSYSENLDVHSLRGSSWRSMTEHMHALQVTFFAATERILQDVLQHVRIFCLTLDGFNQIRSGKSALSWVLEDSTIELAILDEAHQAHFSIVASHAASTRFTIRRNASSSCLAAMRLDSTASPGRMGHTTGYGPSVARHGCHVG